MLMKSISFIYEKEKVNSMCVWENCYKHCAILMIQSPKKYDIQYPVEFPPKVYFFSVFIRVLFSKQLPSLQTQFCLSSKHIYKFKYIQGYLIIKEINSCARKTIHRNYTLISALLASLKSIFKN